MKFTAKTGNSQDCAEVDGPSKSSGWGLTASHSAAFLDHSALRCPLRVTSRASRSRPCGRIRANAGSDPPSPRAGRSCCCPGRPPQSSQRECNRECRRCAGTHSDGSAPETPQAPRAFRGQGAKIDKKATVHEDCGIARSIRMKAHAGFYHV
ncbi:MAG: hypothetical protein RLZZ253_3089 [Verrucomicrobiota bacterium]